MTSAGTVVLRSLYEGAINDLDGGRVMSAVHTLVTRSDGNGTTPTEAQPLTDIGASTVVFQTPQLLLPRTVVDVSGGTLLDVNTQIRNCVHQVASTSRGVAVVHMRLADMNGTDTVVNLSFNKTVTPPPSTAYYTCDPQSRTRDFTVTVHHTQHVPEHILRLSFFNSDAYLRSATIGVDDVFKGHMHAGAYVSSDANPELHILGHDMTTLTITAAQDLQLTVDDAPAVAYTTGDAIVLPASYASVRATQVQNALAPLVNIQCSVNGVVPVVRAAHPPLDDVVHNSNIDSINRVDTRGGFFADATYSDGAAGTVEHIRVATDPAYGPAFAFTSNAELVSVLHAALMSTITSTVPPDVVFNADPDTSPSRPVEKIVRVKDGLHVRCAWTARLQTGHVLPEHIQRVQCIDTLMSMLYIVGETRPVRLVYANAHGARVLLNDGRNALYPLFHGFMNLVTRRIDNGSPQTFSNTTPRSGRLDCLDRELLSVTVAGVPCTDITTFTQGKTAVIDSIDSMRTIVSKQPGAHNALFAKFDVVNAASDVVSVVQSGTGADAAYIASQTPLLSDTSAQNRFDVWSVDDGTVAGIVAWTQLSHVYHIHANVPVVHMPLAESGNVYALLGLLAYDDAYTPNGVVEVTSFHRFDSTLECFSATPTSTKPTLLALNAPSSGVAVTSQFASTKTPTIGVAASVEDALNAGFSTALGINVRVTDVAVLLPRQSATFGFVRADGNPLTTSDVGSVALGFLREQVVVAGPDVAPDVTLSEAYHNVSGAPAAPASRVWVSSDKTAVVTGSRVELPVVVHVAPTGLTTQEEDLIADSIDTVHVMGVVMQRAQSTGVTIFTQAGTSPGTLGAAWLAVPHTAVETMQSPSEMTVLKTYAGDAQMRVECPTPCIVTWTPRENDVPFTYAHPGITAGPAQEVIVASEFGILFDTGTSVLDGYFVSMSDSLGQRTPPLKSVVQHYTTATGPLMDNSDQQYIVPTLQAPLGLLPVVHGGTVHAWPLQSGSAHQPIRDAVGVNGANTHGNTRFAPLLYRPGGVAGSAHGNVVRSGNIEHVYVQFLLEDASTSPNTSQWSAEYSVGTLATSTAHITASDFGPLLVLDDSCTALQSSPVFVESGVAAVYRRQDSATLHIAPRSLPLTPIQALYPVRELGDVSSADTLADALSPAPQPPLHSVYDTHGKPSTRARMVMNQPGSAGAAGVFDTALPDLPPTVPHNTFLGVSGTDNLDVFVAAPRAFDAELALTPAVPHPGGCLVLDAQGNSSGVNVTHSLHSGNAGGVSATWLVSPHADGTWAALPLETAISVVSCERVRGMRVNALGVRAGEATAFALTSRDVDASKALGGALMTAAFLTHDVVDGGVRFEGVDAAELQNSASHIFYVKLDNVLGPLNNDVFTREIVRVPDHVNIFSFSAGIPENTALQDNPDSTDGPLVHAVALSCLCAAIVPTLIDDVQGSWGGGSDETPGSPVIEEPTPPTPSPSEVLDTNSFSSAQIATDVALLGITPATRRRLGIPEEWLASNSPSWSVIRRLLSRRAPVDVSTARELEWFLKRNVARRVFTLGFVLAAFRVYRIALPASLRDQAEASGRRRAAYTIDAFDLF